MEINYGLIVKTENGDIIHFVAYEDEPTIEDAQHLSHELGHDKEFGLTEIADSLTIEVAEPHIVDMFKVYVEGQV